MTNARCGPQARFEEKCECTNIGMTNLIGGAGAI
jgi:hypothetical protein